MLIRFFILYFSSDIVRCRCSDKMSITQLPILNVDICVFQFFNGLYFFSLKSLDTISWMIVFIKSKINSSWCCWITTDNNIVSWFILFTNSSLMTYASNVFLFFERVKIFFSSLKSLTHNCSSNLSRSSLYVDFHLLLWRFKIILCFFVDSIYFFPTVTLHFLDLFFIKRLCHFSNAFFCIVLLKLSVVLFLNDVVFRFILNIIQRSVYRWCVLHNRRHNNKFSCILHYLVMTLIILHLVDVISVFQI